MNFGEILKNLMRDEGVTQADLAKSIGYTQRAVSKWVNNQSEPTETAIIKCAEYFKVSTDYILGIEDELGIKVVLGTAQEGRHAMLKKKETLTASERELLKKYRSISPDLQKMLFEILGTWISESTPNTIKN